MNIAIFTPSKNPYSETFIQAHKLYLKGNVVYYYESGWEIQVEGEPPLKRATRSIALKLSRKLLNKPHYYLMEQAILQSLSKHKIDVVLAEYGTHAAEILPVIKRSGIPMVVHFHGYDATRTDVLQLHKNYAELFAYASSVIAVSTKMKEMLLQIDCPPEKLVYNVYGPRPEFMEVTPEFSKKQMVALGRFTDKKAPYYTILAFAEALKKHPDARLLLGGDGKLLEVCKNLVRLKGLQDSVRFIGVISREEFIELLTQSLAFVQHSIRPVSGDMEGTPLSILESSAAGLPVIATQHAGIPDIIVHNETGLLCEEHDVKQMTANMVTLMDDKELARAMGAKGKARIKEHFTLERHINALQEILEAAAR